MEPIPQAVDTPGAPSAGDAGGLSVISATWLDSVRLALAVELDADRGSPQHWRAFAADPAAAPRARALRVARTAAHATPRVTWLVTVVCVEAPGGRRPKLGLGPDAAAIAVDAESIRARLVAPGEFARVCAGLLDRRSRVTAVELLAGAGGTAPGLALSRTLHQVREILRPALPVAKVAPGVDFSMRVERVTRIDPQTFWVSGYVHAAELGALEFTAISPEGVHVRLPATAQSFHPRPGLTEKFGQHPDLSPFGYELYVALGTRSVLLLGWTVEARSPTGEAFQDTARNPVLGAPGDVREALRQPQRRRVAPDAKLEGQLLPAVTRWTRSSASGGIRDVTQFGTPQPEPAVSILIATPATDRIEHQLIEFARDPEIAHSADVELIYAVPLPPSGDAALERLADGLTSLHRMSFTLARLSAHTPRPRALNVAASLAGGRLLALLDGDTFATSPGWLGRLRDFLDATPEAGAVGPMLLYEDGSIADAGASFTASRREGWRRHSPLRGLSPSLPGASEPRVVQALSDGCLLTRAELFHDTGGLCELYLEDGDATGDLCLGLAEAGHPSWYLPEAQLHWLPRGAWRTEPTLTTERFNAWLLDRRWASHLARGGADPVAVTPARPPAYVPAPRATSADPGARVELLEVAATGAPLAGVVESAGHDSSLYLGTYAVGLEAWIAAEDGATPTGVELVLDGRTVAKGIADARAGETARRSVGGLSGTGYGFQLNFSALTLPREFELTAEARFDGGRRTKIGTVRGRRGALRSRYEPVLQSLSLTSVGRTGTNWLIALLSRHPQLVSVPPFEVGEAMFVQYWIGVLHGLAQPATYLQTLYPYRTRRSHWPFVPSPLPAGVGQPELARWLGGDNLELLAGFCQSQFDAFYSEVAHREQHPDARYFIHKSGPGPVSRTTGELYPDGKEVVLVRDFRDWICSRIDFSAQNAGFAGPDQFASLGQWLAAERRIAEALLGAWQERRERIHLVRYEDLILAPEATLERLLAHVGVDHDAATVAAMREGARRLNPDQQTRHRTSTSVEASIGRWKDDLSPELRGQCAELFDDLLVAFGYEPTSAAEDASGG